MDCSICLEKVQKTPFYPHPTHNHAFHRDCILRWLDESTNSTASCPYCSCPIENFEKLFGAKSDKTLLELFKKNFSISVLHLLIKRYEKKGGAKDLLNDLMFTLIDDCYCTVEVLKVLQDNGAKIFEHMGFWMMYWDRWFKNCDVQDVIDFVQTFAGPELFGNQNALWGIMSEKGSGLFIQTLILAGLPVTAFDDLPIKCAIQSSEFEVFQDLISKHPSFDIKKHFFRIFTESTVSFRKQVLTKVVDWSQFSEKKIMDIIEDAGPQVVFEVLKGLAKYNIKPKHKEILKKIIFQDDAKMFEKYAKLYPAVFTKQTSASLFQITVKDGGPKVLEWFLKQSKTKHKVDLKVLKAVQKGDCRICMALICKAHSEGCKPCKALVKQISPRNSRTVMTKMIGNHK